MKRAIFSQKKSVVILQSKMSNFFFLHVLIFFSVFLNFEKMTTTNLKIKAHRIVVNNIEFLHPLFFLSFGTVIFDRKK